MRFKITDLIPTIIVFLGTVDAVTIYVPEDYETIHQALFTASPADTVIVREYYYRERIPRFDDMPTVICEGWEPEFVDVVPKSPKEFRDEVCGDANGDEFCSVNDIVFLSDYFYSGGPAPEPGGDADNDGSITPQDIAYLVDHFYFSGPPPCYYGWQGQMQVNTPDDSPDGSPDIATDAFDKLWATWMGRTTPADIFEDIFVADWNGQSWSDEVNVHPPDTFEQARSSIAFDSQGHGICVWQESLAEGPYFPNIYYAFWDGIDWQVEGSVNAVDSLIDAGPEIAFGGGEYWATWIGDRAPDSTFYDVYASRWNGAGWDAEMRVNPADEHFDHVWTRVSVDQDGSPHVAWSTGGGVYANIFYSSFNGVNWSDPYQVNEPDSNLQDLDPGISVDDSGCVHVVWSGKSDDGDYHIYYSCFDGENWSQELRINEIDSQGDYRARVAVKTPNDIWVCWDGPGVDSEYHIYAMHFDGQEWIQEERIDSDTTDFDHGTDITIDLAGCPWVIWDGEYRSGSSRFEIFCNYYQSYR
jgi:hypothetical protein